MDASAQLDTRKLFPSGGIRIRYGRRPHFQRSIKAPDCTLITAIWFSRRSAAYKNRLSEESATSPMNECPGFAGSDSAGNSRAFASAPVPASKLNSNTRAFEPPPTYTFL